MATNRRTVNRPSRGQLTFEQELELCLGPSHRGSAFGSPAEVRIAWLKNRDRLLLMWSKNGKRPAAWWNFEAPFPRPREREQSRLYEAGLLTEPERVELVAWWRQEFERAWDPHFFFCDGPGRFFEGAVARRKHYDWADIPRALVREWTARRRRRGRTIGRLAKTVTEAAVVGEPSAA
jgi:hypothetical protein